MATLAPMNRSPLAWRHAVVILPGMLISATQGMASPSAPDAHTLTSIARDIEALKERFPQLKEFSHERNVNAAALSISYAYRTHKAKHGAGWTAGVPHPDDDGVWFYIDLHDPASTAQIHTQPVASHPQCLGTLRVGFLMLEGRDTASISGAVWQALRKHGVAECRE